MPSAFPHLRQPGRIGSLLVPHRVLMGAMHLGIEGPTADVAQLCAFYAERARGQAALIITGGVAVSPEGVGEGGNYFVFGRPPDEAALEQLARVVHDEGGRIALQLFHAGRYASAQETGLPPIGPSALPSRFHPGESCQMADETEIERLIHCFASSGRRARDLGFDAVEVMGSEGYLLNEFLAPVTNQRTDAWGGGIEGRMRFPLTVVHALRQALGATFPLIYRISGADLVDDGTPWEDTLEFARRLEASGVDALDIGIGWHESTVPTVGTLVPRAAFAAIAAGIRRTVQIPIIAANRINTPEVAERMLSSGAADFVSLARPLLADPAFAAKALSGNRERINVCVACNQACLDHVMGRPPRPAGCLVNPVAGREATLTARATQRPRSVAVVGGGPAGLEAARILGQRGHRVTLFEQETALGGQLRYAAMVPGKGEFHETLRYYEAELAAYAVEVRTGIAATDKDLIDFDSVVVATGVRPFVPDDLPGVALPHVVTYPDVFTGRARVGQRVAIIGAGGIACDLAHFLSEDAPVTHAAFAFLSEYGVIPMDRALPNLFGSRTITMMRRGQRIAPLLGRTTRWAVLGMLRRRGVRMLTEVQYRAITPEGVHIVRAGNEEFIPADTVILACGQTASAELAAHLHSDTLHVIGGARKAGELDAERAILEGYVAGCAI